MLDWMVVVRTYRDTLYDIRTSAASVPPRTMADEAKSSAQKAKLSQAALSAAAGALIPHSGALPMEGRAAAQEVDLEDLFSLRRPKNAWSGASSGLQSIAKGAR